MWNSVRITTTSVVVVRSILDATVRQEWGRSWAGDKLVLEPPNYAAACQLRGGGAAFMVLDTDTKTQIHRHRHTESHTHGI